VNTMKNGDAAEVGTIGNEGMVVYLFYLATPRLLPAFMCRSPVAVYG
jgi:hypothetical protein